MTDHSECLYEINYLRDRVETADLVIKAARQAVSFDATKDDQATLIHWLSTYSSFLGIRSDPARDAHRQEYRAKVGLSTPLLGERRG